MKINYIIGDIHLGDNTLFDIVYKYDFNSMDDYINVLTKNYNAVVKEYDTVLFLGDLGQKEFIEKHLPLFKGNKILIKGNHDKYELSFYEKFFEKVYDHPLYLSNQIIASHHPVLVEEGIINLHGHTHNVFLDSNKHINLCVEHTKYAPIMFNELDYIKDLNKPNISFLQEWYKDIQIWRGKKADDLVLDSNNIIDIRETHRLKELSMMNKIGETIIENGIENYDNLKKRQTIRAIVIKNGKILMLYSKLFDDYTFPGGGLKDDENHFEALRRELLEEVGAKEINILKSIGYTEEIRYGISGSDSVYMQKSFYYLCEINNVTKTEFSKRELEEGLEAKYIEPTLIIKHNEKRNEERKKEVKKGYQTVLCRDNIVLQLLIDKHL